MTDRGPDGGLQHERTRLAWGRTALSFAGVGALLLHIGDRSHTPLREVPGVVTLCAAAAIYVLGTYRYRATRPGAGRDARRVSSAAALGAATGLALLASALSLLLMLTGR